MTAISGNAALGYHPIVGKPLFLRPKKMDASPLFVKIMAFIVLAHLVVGFGYLMYKLNKPGDKHQHP